MSAQLLAGTKKKRKELPQSTLDAFFMLKSEIRLTEWICETRELGIPVETYMLAIIGHEMLEEKFPERYANQDSSGFKAPFLFSNCWQLGYFN
jgi:hypothetical protein